jgi:SAM-dependent methyltransferase
VKNLIRQAYSLMTGHRFSTSSDYWQRRYTDGGTSGPGSYGRLARFKATVLNDLVKSKGVNKVIELGCGDGAQLTLAEYPAYIGVDVSPTAVNACKARFPNDPNKSFVAIDEFRRARPTADLTLSLDVIYHLVEDAVFDEYMRDLFTASERLVAIYSSNSDRIADPAPHVRHRVFTDWVTRGEPDWHLSATHKNPYPHRWHDRKNTSHCDLFVFEKRT